MPLEGSGKTGDDLITDQEAIARVDQLEVDIPQPMEAPSGAPEAGTTTPQLTVQSQQSSVDSQSQVSVADSFAGPSMA